MNLEISILTVCCNPLLLFINYFGAQIIAYLANGNPFKLTSLSFFTFLKNINMLL